MSNALSLLQNASPNAIRLEPFPHLIIDAALPPALCEQLCKSYPPLATMGVDSASNNQRWSYSAHRTLANDAIAPAWHAFIAYHTSAAFYAEVMALFREPAVALYGARAANLRPGLRHQDGYRESDILLDAQICGNTPVARASSVRTTHIDKNNKLFAGLYYLRSDADDSHGGDLELNRFLPTYAGPNQQRDCYRGVYVDSRCVETVTTVPYRKNTLILFLNSPLSLHGVSIRQPTQHQRLFVNLLGETELPLFQTPKPRLSVRLKRRLGAADAG